MNDALTRARQLITVHRVKVALALATLAGAGWFARTLSNAGGSELQFGQGFLLSLAAGTLLVGVVLGHPLYVAGRAVVADDVETPSIGSAVASGAEVLAALTVVLGVALLYGTPTGGEFNPVVIVATLLIGAGFLALLGTVLLRGAVRAVRLRQ